MGSSGRLRPFLLPPEVAPLASTARSLLETRGAGALGVLWWLRWPGKMARGAGHPMVGLYRGRGTRGCGSMVGWLGSGARNSDEQTRATERKGRKWRAHWKFLTSKRDLGFPRWRQRQGGGLEWWRWLRDCTGNDGERGSDKERGKRETKAGSQCIALRQNSPWQRRRQGINADGSGVATCWVGKIGRKSANEKRGGGCWGSRVFTLKLGRGAWTVVVGCRRWLSAQNARWGRGLDGAGGCGKRTRLTSGPTS